MLITVLYLSLLLQSGLAVVVLQSGDQVSPPGVAVMLECSMGPGFSMGSYTMLWYRQKHYGAPMEFLTKEYEQGGGRFQSPLDTPNNNFSLQITELFLNDSSTYYCAAALITGGADNQPAYFGQGTKLTVLESGLEVTKPTVKVLKPSQKECRNSKAERKKTLVCVASQFYPDHVSVNWEIDGANVEDGVATDNAALRNGSYYKITSRLRVFAEDWNKEGINFTCIVSFFNGKETITVAKTIQSVKEFIEGKNVTRDKYMRITHTAKFSYGVFIAKSSIYGAFVAFLVWKLQGSNGKQNN